MQLESHKLNYHLDRVLSWRSGEPVVPVTVEISPSSSCNHRCLMCGYEHLGHKLGLMPGPLLRRTVSEVARAGVRGVVFAGDGEPFCHPELLPAITLLREAGVEVAVSTNGALMREGDMPQLVRRLTWLRFSVNGTTADNYGRVHRCPPETFELVLAKIARLAGEKERQGGTVTIGVQLVLLPENIAGLRAFAQRIKESGADYLVFKPFYYNGNNRYGQQFSLDYQHHAAELAEVEALSTPRFLCQMRWETLRQSQRSYSRCLGWPFFYYIRTDGEVFPCLARQDEARLSLGNLDRVSFAAICQGERQAGVAVAMAGVDPATCQPNCRHHAINTFLWDLSHPPEHKNFV